MCGIAGVLELEPGRQPSMEELGRMAGVLVHRGPDQGGFHRSGPVGLAHRRLSIIDLASGQQPMGSPDAKVWVVFNGEIYNYPGLKDELEKKGYTFRTRSDTEVLLALYLQDGLEAFPKINGMFACAFWDGRTGQLVLARDRVGKKPLFYYRDEHRFLFGSEVKALLAHGAVERTVNPLALHQYLTHSYIVGEEAIIAGIRRLPPASFLVVDQQQLAVRKYWALRFEPNPEPPDEREAVERLEHLLRQAVRRRLMSEVPLGAFLSGGLDSSAVVAMMAALSDQPVRTFSVGFEESEYSELADARLVAKYLGTDHHEMVVKPSALEILPELVWHLDEPFGDSSAVPTYYVCRAARQHVTVALSGDGGDEVFAGYTRYQQLERYHRISRVPAWLRRGVIAPLAGALPFTWPAWNYLYAVGRLGDAWIPMGLGMYPYIQEQLYSPDFKKQVKYARPFSEAERILQQVGHLDPISRFQYLDTLQYLPADILTKVDRMSMANSLEVRSPLLDYELVEYMATLPVSFKIRGQVTKYLFRKLGARLLPPSVLTKRKQGFAIPKDRWFRTQLRTVAEDILLDGKTISRGYFHERTIRKLLLHHATGRRDYSAWIWCLMVLEVWHRLFVDVETRRTADVKWD
jgi:asparagine synthase (glutamine-hydrolysing)